MHTGYHGRFHGSTRSDEVARKARGRDIFHSSDETQAEPDVRRLSARAHDTFIDPVASNVYESLFESEDESADARQVHGAGLSAPLFLPAPLMRIIRLSFFFSFFIPFGPARYTDRARDPFRHGTGARRYARQAAGARPAFLICLSGLFGTHSSRACARYAAQFRRQDRIKFELIFRRAVIRGKPRELGDPSLFFPPRKRNKRKMRKRRKIKRIICYNVIVKYIYIYSFYTYMYYILHSGNAFIA